MSTAFPRIPIFVKLLDALPMRLADGLSLLESDVAECLVIQVFGQRITLPIGPSATNDEVVFEGAMGQPLVQIPNLCTLSLPRVRIAIQSFAHAHSISFDLLARARLEFHGFPASGGDSFVIEGNMRVVTQQALALKQLRIDFDHSAFSLPLAAGAILLIRPYSLHVSPADDGSVIVEMRVACSMDGFAPSIQEVLDKRSFEALVRWSRDTMTLAATTVCEGIVIPLPTFGAFGGGAARNLGVVTLSARYLRINIGRAIECSLDIGVGIPLVLQDIMEPRIDLRLSAVNDDVRLELLSSPFRTFECSRVPNGNLRARVPVGKGKVSLDLPALRIDWARRCIVAEGQISHQNLRIPLAPLRSLLERAGMHSLGKELPDSVAFQSFGLTGVAAAFSEWAAERFGNHVWSEPVRTIVDNVLKNLHHLPPRFQEQFLRVHVPKEIAFRFECSFDFDARLHLAPSNDPIRAAASPIRLLIPFIGEKGPELLGVILYRWAFGELHAGQIFVIEIDAEIERFELLPLSLATTVQRDGAFAVANEVPSRLLLRDVVALTGLSGGIPWIAPLNFRKIGLTHAGLDGLVAVFQCELSLPNVDFRTLMHWLVRLRNLPLHGADLVSDLDDGPFECHVGPAYVRLPHSLGGKSFGSTDEVISLRASGEIQRLLRTWHTLDAARFLEIAAPRMYEACRPWLPPGLGFGFRAGEDAHDEREV